MSAIVKRIYKITIKLTNNDENDEKEFTINNMSQILLQNFAASNSKELKNGVPDDLSHNSYIYMLKENFYIDNEVLKSIRGSKGEKNKFIFKDFGNRDREQIVNEFYTPILTYNDDTIKINILTQILIFALESIENAEKIADKKEPKYKDEKAKRTNKMDLLKRKIEAITKLPTDDSKAIKDFVANFIDILNILVEKNVMSYLQSIYDNTNDNSQDKINFRKNLTNIMLKINSDPNANSELNKIETYRYFLKFSYIDTIFETIQNNIILASKNGQQGNYSNFYRPNLLNNPEMSKQIIKENMKYVYPDKTNVETLAESEELDILLFHNILYIIKKIYLLDTTIICVKDEDNHEKKFFIKNLTLEETNPFKLDKVKSGDTFNVFINFKCDIKYINENPLLKINYIVDDTEILDKTNHLKIIEFEPKNFNKSQDFNKYSSTYIYDTIDYKSYDSKINKILNTIKMQKIIKSKEELFFNTIALNEFNNLLNINFKSSDDAIIKKNIYSNILYFLKNILKLYNGKEITHANASYFVYDTLITTDISNTDISNTNPTNPVLNFYSISENKSIKYNNFKGEKILKNFLKILNSLQLQKPSYNDKFDIYKVESRDARIERNSYYIFILFICYKADEKGNRPSLQKRVIGEVCLERAKILDKAFYNLIYSKLNIPETYLYNKLINLQKPKQAKTAKNKELPPNVEAEPKLEAQAKLEPKISGGNKKYTRKNYRRTF